MKKSTRIVKKLLALFLVVLMSINTFAAIVGDNDGAAFITKAEFDSMKNDFQSQLDRYNSSIDNKIDGSIASYLTGLNVKKQSEIDYPNKITDYKSINRYSAVESRVHLNHTNTIVITRQWGNNGGGACDLIGTVEIPGANGRGIIATTFGENRKECFIRGFGTFNDEYIAFGYEAQGNDQAFMDTLNGRVRNIQLFWWKAPRTYNTAGKAAVNDGMPTTNTYYGDVWLDDSGDNAWKPYCYGHDMTTSNYVLGISKGPNFVQHKRTVDIQESSIGLIVNDYAVKTIIDDTYFNGITIKLDNTFYGTLNYNWYYHPYVTNNYAADNSNNYYQIRNSYGWSAQNTSKWGDAYLNITNFNTGVSPGNRENRVFNGKNKLLYGSWIQNPEGIWTNQYTNTNFLNWLSKVSDENARKTFQNQDVWNLRYGNLLLCEDTKDGAEYQIVVKNNDATPAMLKLFDDVQSTNFDSIVGIQTDQSSGTNNQITIGANETKTIKFETFNANPIFFKCNNDANISFEGSIKKVEK